MRGNSLHKSSLRFSLHRSLSDAGAAVVDPLIREASFFSPFVKIERLTLARIARALDFIQADAFNLWGGSISALHWGQTVFRDARTRCRSTFLREEMDFHSELPVNAGEQNANPSQGSPEFVDSK